MKKSKKTERLIVLISPEQAAEIDTAAKAQGVDIPEYTRKAISFYSHMNVDFFAQLQPVADEMKVPLPTLIQNLLMSYVATEKAALDVFNVQPKAFQRAFQFDGKALITTGKLSDLVYVQAKKDAEAVKERLEEGVREKKAVHITTAQAAFVASHVAAAAL